MLWACKDEVTGGNARLVGQTCFPKGLGGLSILDLEKLARDLRFKWLWLEWAAPDKPWVRVLTPNDDIDRQIFSAATRVTIEDCMKASLWSSSWLNGQTL
jgi:hypothetical protein